MIRNLQLIKSHSQLKELGSYLKYSILKELIKAPATCQQLATLFDHSKQKIHYNLSQMLSEGLLEIVEEPLGSNREVYYRATAKSYVLDFAIGLEANDRILDSRAIIGGILEQEHRISLENIAAKLLDQAFKLKKGDRILISTGKFNLPLVEKLMLEAGRRGIITSLIYQDMEQLKAKYESYSLAAFQADYEEFNRLLKNSDMFLNLNGESRSLELRDPEKLMLRNRMLEKGRQIIQDKKIRIAVMPGLLNDTLSDQAIESELQFWRALDIDYPKLCKQTLEMCQKFMDKGYVDLSTQEEVLRFEIERIWAECGSFGNNKFHSPVINLPGGEILIIPKPESMKGRIVGDRAFAFGEEISRPQIEIRNNEIIHFSAESNERLLAKAIAAGGLDGRKVALICLGTNDNIRLGDIDNALKHKSNGFLSLFWGNNRALGGSVSGTQEWFVQVENPGINFV
jgi:leucyl aminopeptidase (aminopeptidase T)